MVERSKKINRVRINISTLDFEVESSTESLDKVFAMADMIARNLGKPTGIDGKTWEERVHSAGVR